MKPQNNVKPNGLANEIRWQHSESTGILVDRLGHGDVSGWSKGVSRPFGSAFKPKRPEVGELVRESHPVRKLSEVRPVIDSKHVAAHPVTFAEPTDFNETNHAAKVGEKSLANALRAEAHFKSCRVKTAKAKKVKEAESPFDPIPESELKAWLIAKKEALFPRGKNDKAIFTPPESCVSRLVWSRA